MFQIDNYRYTVEDGKIKILHLSTNQAESVDENTFKIIGFWDKDREFKLNDWHMYHRSSNSYDYEIYIKSEDDIKNHLKEIQDLYLKFLNYEISRLQASIDAINQSR